MTTVDRSVDFVKVLMIVPRKEFYKEIPLQEEYTYQPYTDDMLESWCKLHVETGLFETMEEAKDNIETMLKEDRKAFENQFVFVCDKKGQLVGSCGLWKGTHFGMERLRLHDVSVLPSCQHQGIAKSMIVRCARMYDEMKSRYPLYVVSQSQSYGAIALYSRLGFTPYLGEYKNHTKAQSEKDWEKVTAILKEKVQ